MNNIITLIILTVFITLAQVVMKFAAHTSNQLGIWNHRVLILISISFVISCLGQIVWLYVLKTSSLSASYLFLALVFVFVPLSGYFLFKESISLAQATGIVFILVGVAIQGYAGTR
jgi:drug/metabolite transporter (DMT)-like permease